MSESSATTEIIIRLPQQLIAELDGYAEQENVNHNEIIYRATKMYLRERKNAK